MATTLTEAPTITGSSSIRCIIGHEADFKIIVIYSTWRISVTNTSQNLEGIFWTNSSHDRHYIKFYFSTLPYHLHLYSNVESVPAEGTMFQSPAFKIFDFLFGIPLIHDIMFGVYRKQIVEKAGKNILHSSSSYLITAEEV